MAMPNLIILYQIAERALTERSAAIPHLYRLAEIKPLAADIAAVVLSKRFETNEEHIQFMSSLIRLAEYMMQSKLRESH